LRLKCTKFDFGRGSAPDPAVGAYSAPPDPLAGFKGPTSKGGRGREETEGEGKGLLIRGGRQREGRGKGRGRVPRTGYYGSPGSRGAIVTGESVADKTELVLYYVAVFVIRYLNLTPCVEFVLAVEWRTREISRLLLSSRD